MEADFISFVIPCYRSEKTISDVVEEIKSEVDDRYDYEMILVNDCSPDGTWRVIQKLCNCYPNRIKAISLSKNFGQASAIMAGLKYALGDIVICLDDDGQTPIENTIDLINKIKEGYDLVFADYFEKKESPFRLFGSKLNELMMDSLLDKPKNVVVNSFFACTRMVVDEVTNYRGAFPYLPGLMLRSTRNIANIRTIHRNRKEGKSGYTFGKLLALWLSGFTSFSVKPLRIAVFIGVIFSMIGFCFMAVLIIRKILDNNVQLGWTSIVSVMTFFDGLILMVLGLMGEYIGRIYLCINASPQYVIKNMIGFDRGEN